MPAHSTATRRLVINTYLGLDLAMAKVLDNGAKTRNGKGRLPKTEYNTTPPERMYFIDLDGTVVEPGTYRLLPGALKSLGEIAKNGKIVWFSVRDFTQEDMKFLNGLGIPFYGTVHKPLAAEYVVIDDRLNTGLSRTSLKDAKRVR